MWYFGFWAYWCELYKTEFEIMEAKGQLSNWLIYIHEEQVSFRLRETIHDNYQRKTLT